MINRLNRLYDGSHQIDSQTSSECGFRTSGNRNEIHEERRAIVGCEYEPLVENIRVLLDNSIFASGAVPKNVKLAVEAFVAQVRLIKETQKETLLLGRVDDLARLLLQPSRNRDKAVLAMAIEALKDSVSSKR